MYDVYEAGEIKIIGELVNKFHVDGEEEESSKLIFRNLNFY